MSFAFFWQGSYFSLSFSPGDSDIYEELFFLPTSRKVLFTFRGNCQDGSHFAQTVIHLAHFHVQTKKRGVLYVHIPERSV